MELMRHHILEAARLRQADLLREAARVRLARAVNQREPRFWTRALQWLRKVGRPPVQAQHAQQAQKPYSRLTV